MKEPVTLDPLVQSWLFAMIGLLTMAGSACPSSWNYVAIGVLACIGCVCSTLGAAAHSPPDPPKDPKR